MFDIRFPVNNNQRYFEIHYKYVLEIFKYLKCNIKYMQDTAEEPLGFSCYINNKPFLFDFGDSARINVNNNNGFPIFKFHATEKTKFDVIPFPPVSFYSWQTYYELEKQIKYDPNNEIVSNRQRPYGNATERRLQVQKMLKSMLRDEFLRTNEIQQVDYWKEINELGLSIHIPGQNSNIYDRGQAQYMAFGMCTVSPYLPEILPFNTTLDNCYIKCTDDYINLYHIILDKPNKAVEYFKEIGDRAKKIFQNTSTPEAIGEWIYLCLA